MDKIEINFIKKSCASHILLKKMRHISLLYNMLKKIHPTQFREKLCLIFFFFFKKKVNQISFLSKP